MHCPRSLHSLRSVEMTEKGLLGQPLFIELLGHVADAADAEGL